MHSAHIDVDTFWLINQLGLTAPTPQKESFLPAMSTCSDLLRKGEDISQMKLVSHVVRDIPFLVHQKLQTRLFSYLILGDMTLVCLFYSMGYRGSG